VTSPSLGRSALLADRKNTLRNPLEEKLPEVNDSVVEGLKFASALADDLAHSTVAERLADFPAIREVLTEPRTFVRHDR
jgi:hypothetical protein